MATFKYLQMLMLIALVCGSPLDDDLPAVPMVDDPSSDGAHLIDQLIGNSKQDGISIEAYQMPPLDRNEQTLANDMSINLHFKVKTDASSGGAIYTRWGSSSCIDGSQLVYSGTAGGSHYSDVGGGSNYLCMPSEPIYDEVAPGVSDYRGLLYSSEYETHDGPSRLRGVHDHTPTCAVCRAPSDRMTKLMVPGRNVCPSASWRLEYKGYLMAARHTHNRSDFICMDRDMEVEPGTEGDQDGALFYLVETMCLAGGGLPCGPYVQGYELTCAVCTI